MQAILPVVLGVVVVWLVAASVILFLIYKHYSRLTKDVKGENLMRVLEGILKTQAGVERDIGNLKRNILQIEEAMQHPVQKVGVVRFNPFSETGGAQSFAVSLLNRNDDGFILTGLHSRDRTRLYIKPVKGGKGELELSQEEKRAIAQAMKTKRNEKLF